MTESGRLGSFNAKHRGCHAALRNSNSSKLEMRLLIRHMHSSMRDVGLRQDDRIATSHRQRCSLMAAAQSGEAKWAGLKGSSPAWSARLAQACIGWCAFQPWRVAEQQHSPGTPCSRAALPSSQQSRLCAAGYGSPALLTADCAPPACGHISLPVLSYTSLNLKTQQA